MRAGASVEDVAAETGWPLERVARYAGPPLDERAYVADRACNVQIRATDGGITLAESALVVLSSAGLASAIAWDSWRRADGKWVVSCTDDSGVAACWTYDSVGRTVHPLDERARWLMGVSPEAPARPSAEPQRAPQAASAAPAPTPAPEPTPAPAPAAADPRPRLVAVPSEPESTTHVTAPVPGLPQRPPAAPPAAHQPPARTEPPADQGTEQTVLIPAQKKSKGKSRRSSVPSWDEILFGAGKTDD